MPTEPTAAAGTVVGTVSGATSLVPPMVTLGASFVTTITGNEAAGTMPAIPVAFRLVKATVTTALAECGDVEIVRQFEALERSRRVDALERSRRVDALELFSRSTDRLSRQNRMVDMIGNSRQRPNISSLARDFKVARRTIIRDFQELIRRGQLDPEIYPEWETPLPDEAD